MHNFSKRALLEFIKTSIDKGRINANTGAGINAACRKVLEQVGVEEDIRTVDVKSAVIQYANRHPHELSGDSLRVYESRVRGVIDNFVKSVTDPTGFKLPGKQNGSVARRADRHKAGVDSVTSTRQAAKTKAEPDVQAGSARASVTEASLAIPFPLRPTFLAQIVIPRDLTKDEAKRLASFIDALSHDPPKQT